MVNQFRKCGGMSRWRVAVVAAGVLGLAGLPARAAVAGAWETFFDETNAGAWRVYDDADQLNYVPNWSSGTADGEYVDFNFVQDYLLSFWADVRVGSGALVGDYQAQQIAGISCDVFIGDLAELDSIDCGMLATGPGGTTFYRSDFYFWDDFAASGWWTVEFMFDQPWFYDDGTDWIEVDARQLTVIEEVDVTFYPVANSTGGSRVGIDNLTLEPTVVAPKLTTSVTTGTPKNFRLAFTPGPGLKYRLEKLRTPPTRGWSTVIGQPSITPPGEYVFLTPATGKQAVFRVAAEAYYSMIFTP